MPSHIIAPASSRLRLPKWKPIKKQSINSTDSCTSPPTDCDCIEENTMPEIIQPPSECQSLKNLQHVTRLVKFANLIFKFSLDTYLVCLKILNSLKIDIHSTKIRLTAATVLLIAGKVHEFRTPKFVDLVRWGEFEFRSQDLVTAEAQLLAMLDFRVPVALKLANIKAVQQQVARLEAKIHSQTIQSKTISFQ